MDSVTTLKANLAPLVDPNQRELLFWVACGLFGAQDSGATTILHGALQ
jgi:hypothetical protein